eukprot:s545_g12.t1
MFNRLHAHVLSITCRWPELDKERQAVLITPREKVKKSPSLADLEGQSRTKHKKEKEEQPAEQKIAPRCTAAKAAAKATKVERATQPTEAMVKNECVTPQTARAVQECLKRKSTQDLGNATAPEVSKDASLGGAQDSQSSSDDSSDELDPEELQRQKEEFERKEEQQRLKREAHARYMRFSRSLTSPFTPLEIQRAGRNAKRDSAKLQILLEQWASADGIWTQTEFYLQIKQKRKNRQYGSRRWLTRSELITKFGSITIADQIISAKVHDAEAAKTQIRAHPDLHGQDTEDSLETRQYLIWDREGEEDTVDTVTSQLFEAADGGDEGSQRKKEKSGKGDKNKRGRKARKEKKEKELTEEQKQKKAEQDAEKQRKKDEKDREAADKKAKKEKEDALKKEQRKANQAFGVITKIGSHIMRAAGLEDKLSGMSDQVKKAVLAEVEPHVIALRNARTKLQKAIDNSKAIGLD